MKIYQNEVQEDGYANFVDYMDDLDKFNPKISMLKTYLLLFSLGIFGGHRFYLGKTKSGLLLLLFTFCGIILKGISMSYLMTLDAMYKIPMTSHAGLEYWVSLTGMFFIGVSVVVCLIDSVLVYQVVKKNNEYSL